LIADARDGTLDDMDPLTAALIAGGVTDHEELGRCVSLFFEHSAQRVTVRDQPNDLAAQLFRKLHDHLLTGQYHLEYTSPSRAIREGHFNCVAATILYYCLCEHHGVPVTLLATREHVFINLREDSPRVVETTCHEWFDLAGSDRHRTLQSAIENSREIEFLQLLGKVFYNRALASLAQEDFREAVRLLETSLRFDAADVPARENLLAAYNNWTLSEAADGHYEQALELLDVGNSIDADYSPFLANDVHVRQLWVNRLCQQERFSEALECLRSAYRRRPAVPLFDEGRMAVYQMWAEALFLHGETAAAFGVLQVAREDLATDDRWPAYESAALRQAARPVEYLTNSQS
jgi:tetratricopeptide (TPR) repeat protein